LYVASAPRVCSRLRHERAGSPQPSAESGSLSYGLPVHLRMLSTPPHGDAVSFDYRVATNSGTDSHRSVKASSRTHSSLRPQGPITTVVCCYGSSQPTCQNAAPRRMVPAFAGPTRGQPCASRRFLEQLPPDQHAADFAGAGADLVEFCVAQQPPGRIVVDIAIAAEQLDGV